MLAKQEGQYVGHSHRSGDPPVFPVLIACHNGYVISALVLVADTDTASCYIDDDDAPNLDDDGRVGVIHVSVVRISRRDRVRKPSAPGHHTSGFRSVGVVHERSKKAGSHCVSCVLHEVHLLLS